MIIIRKEVVLGIYEEDFSDKCMCILTYMCVYCIVQVCMGASVVMREFSTIQEAS